MLTPEQLAARVPAVADTSVLSGMYEAALEAIDLWLGADGTVSELLSSGGGDLLGLSRPAEAIISIKENDVELAAADYELRPSGTLLRRLHTGTHPRHRWWGRIDVIYVPFADEASRDRVAVELIKLEANTEPGASSERIGDWSESVGSTVGGGKTYEQLRADIFNSFVPAFIGA